MSGRKLRIALLHPSYWPEVRRGSERLVHDVAAGLAARGHDVTLITSHPAPPTTGVEDGFRVMRNRRARPRSLHRRGYEYYLTNGLPAALSVLRGGYDLAHAFFPVDAAAAASAGRLGGPPVVFSFHGIPTREYLVGKRLRLLLLRRALEEAATTTVLSEAAAERFRRYGLGDPRVFPGGIDFADFAVEAPKARRPTLICGASLNDPRKRGDLLMRAFSALRRRRPEARLLLAGRPDPAQPNADLSLPTGAQWIDGDSTDVLARAYASAWASVLPSVDEAFGLTLLESLAAGTPAVAARSGGCPELLSGEHVGRTFAPDDPDDLARAMDEALTLGESGSAAAACRAQAERYDWTRLLPELERVYEAALSCGRR